MTDMRSIRIATPADFEAVGTLLERSYASLLAGHYDRNLLDLALPFMTRANPRLLASGTYYVAAQEADYIVGCGGWSMERPGSGEITEGEGHIRHVAVHPQWNGRGVGASLLARCFADARPHVRRLNCYSTLNAEPFYQACGFKTIGPIDIQMGPGVSFPSLLMLRELD